MSCNISCQKIDYIFAYCQQNIFWLIEVAFLHIHNIKFFPHITNWPPVKGQFFAKPRGTKRYNVNVQNCQLLLIFARNPVHHLWNCKKNLTIQATWKKRIWGKSSQSKGQRQSQRIMEFHICKRGAAILTKRFLLPAVTDMFQGKKFSTWHRKKGILKYLKNVQLSIRKCYMRSFDIIRGHLRSFKAIWGHTLGQIFFSQNLDF